MGGNECLISEPFLFLPFLDSAFLALRRLERPKIVCAQVEGSTCVLDFVCFFGGFSADFSGLFLRRLTAMPQPPYEGVRWLCHSLQL